jgi:hypothetical protein
MRVGVIVIRVNVVPIYMMAVHHKPMVTVLRTNALTINK